MLLFLLSIDYEAAQVSRWSSCTLIPAADAQQAADSNEVTRRKPSAPSLTSK